MSLSPKERKFKAQEKILDYLGNVESPKHIKKISEETELSRQSVSKNLQELAEEDKVELDSEIGNAKLYKRSD